MLFVWGLPKALPNALNQNMLSPTDSQHWIQSFFGLSRIRSRLRDDRVERLVPGDFLPARIDVETLFRVGPLQRDLDPVRIVEIHDARLALGAHLAAVLRALRIAFDVDRDAVFDLHTNAAADVAHAAGRRDRFRIRRLRSRVHR